MAAHFKDNDQTDSDFRTWTILGYLWIAGVDVLYTYRKPRMDQKRLQGRVSSAKKTSEPLLCMENHQMTSELIRRYRLTRTALVGLGTVSANYYYISQAFFGI